MKRTTNGSGRISLYKSYVFKDKDPVIDELRTLVESTYGKLDAKSLTQIHEEGGPTVACMHQWFHGKTKRPQNPTIEAAGRAMGYQRIWRKMK